MVEIITTKQAEHYFEKNKKTIVVAGGCFDLLHIGHITLLENAKKEGDLLVVLLESDDTIRKTKGIDRPIHNQKERAQLLSSLRPVDVVILLPDEMTNNDYDNLLAAIKPTIIATTKDDPHIIHKERQAKKIGAQVVAVNTYIPSVSTTKLLKILSCES